MTGYVPNQGQNVKVNGVSHPISRWDFDDGETPPEVPALWDNQTAETAWKRWYRLYGKDTLGIIPPNAETAPHLRENRGKIPGRTRDGVIWTGRHGSLTEGDTTLEEIKWWARNCGGIGIKGRTCCGLDNDASNLRIRDGLREIIHKHVGPGPRRGRPNSHRDLHMLLGPGLKSWQTKYRPPGKPKGEKPDLLELKGSGTYYNVEGPHPSGAMYTWENGHPCDGRGADGLPKIDQSIADAIRADAITYLKAEGCEIIEGRGSSPSGSGASSGIRKGLDDDPSRHDEAGTLRYMDLCPNTADHNPYRDNVVRDLIAIKTGLGPEREEHRERGREWFQHPDWPDNDDAEFDKIWDSITDSDLGIEYLRSRCPELRDEATQQFAAEPLSPGYASDAPPLAPGTDKAKRPPISVLTLNEIAERASSEPPDFVEGMICDGGTSGWYGESNVGKSFILLDLGLRVSLGWPWHGRAVERGGVIYIAGEGARGIMQRVAGWRKHHGEEKTAGAWFAVIPDMPNCRDKRAIDGLIEAIKQISPQLGARVRLVIVDTLSRAIAVATRTAPKT